MQKKRNVPQYHYIAGLSFPLRLFISMKISTIVIARNTINIIKLLNKIILVTSYSNFLSLRESFRKTVLRIRNGISF